MFPEKVDESPHLTHTGQTRVLRRPDSTKETLIPAQNTSLPFPLI